MKELTWKPILFNLTEARGEIRDIHCRLHFLQFGELPEEEEPSPGDDSDAEYIAYLERQEKRNPFTESTLLCGLEHAYHHLNWAWKRAGEDWPRPKGLRAGVEDEPFTGKDFTRRMHRIYSTLNMAWNSRMDKTFVGGKRAIDRRRKFSPAFATGCYNMWTRRK